MQAAQLVLIFEFYEVDGQIDGYTIQAAQIVLIFEFYEVALFVS